MLEDLKAVPIDPIFQLLYDFRADDNPKKVNLGIGIYTDDQGEPFVFPSVQKAAHELDVDNFNYQPIRGNGEFLDAVAELLLDQPDLDHLALQVTCGGTQACRVFADLMGRDSVKRKVLVGTPTWGNHYAVFQALDLVEFDHLNEAGEINVQAYHEAVESADEGSILVLHGGLAHNPTGRNLNVEDLKGLIPELQKKAMIVFIDMAYCGLGEGLELDKKFVQELLSALDQVAVGFSFSKNASLYEHRTGVLMVKTDQKEVLESNLQQLMRENVSMAPGFGQEIMLRVLQHSREQWLQELEEARLDIEQRKAALLDQLPEAFQKVRDCRGLFGLMPLDNDQIQRLREEHSVYLLSNGRVNFGGIKTADIPYIAEAMRSVLE